MNHPWFFSYQQITVSRVLRNWTENIYPNEQLAFYGGESFQQIPLLFLLGGYVTPTRGEAFFHQGSSKKPIQPKVIGIGPVHPFTPLFTELQVREALILHATLFQLTNATARADHVINQWGLAAVKHKRIRDLSMVDQKCVEIAMTMIHQPKMILLHHPEQQIPEHTWQDIWHHLLQLQQEESFAIALTTFHLPTAENCTKAVQFEEMYHH
jgi:ABC-type multidrug transport system ATPase subunit